MLNNYLPKDLINICASYFEDDFPDINIIYKLGCLQFIPPKKQYWLFYLCSDFKDLSLFLYAVKTVGLRKPISFEELPEDERLNSQTCSFCYQYPMIYVHIKHHSIVNEMYFSRYFVACASCEQTIRKFPVKII